MDLIIPEVSGFEVKTTDDVLVAEFGPRELREAQQFIQGTTHIIHHLFEHGESE